MNSIWNVHFLVIDVETTGFSPVLHSLIDVACVSLQRENIVGRFSSLINPHLPIPGIISHLTHITNDMVAKAPEEYEVLLKLRDILLFPNAVFTAHNAAFDYPFVKGAYEKEGIDFPKIEKLCTLKLARRLLKKDLKKNVGSLANYFGYEIKDRHRALGDADATAFILNNLLHIAEEDHGVTSLEELLELQDQQIKNYTVTPTMALRLAPFTETLPECPGVFRFKNKNEIIHFIGSAGNLRKDIRTNFLQNKLTSRKIYSMVRKSFSLEYRETNSELEANLLATRETNLLQPYYNGRKDKTIRKNLYIKLNSSYEFPNIEMTENIYDIGCGEYFGPFTSEEVCQKIYDAAEKYFPVRKCQNEHLKIDPNGLPCIYHSFRQCPAPCCGFVTQNEYLRGIEDLRNYLAGSPDAIIANLEKKMYAYAEKLEFEKAQAVKTQIEILRNAPQPVTSDTDAGTEVKNFILVIPADDRHKIVQLLFFRNYSYEKECTIGIKAPASEISSQISAIYFKDENDNLRQNNTNFSGAEMKLVKSFMVQNKDKFRMIQIAGITFDETVSEVSAAVRNFYPPTDDNIQPVDPL